MRNIETLLRITLSRVIVKADKNRFSHGLCNTINDLNSNAIIDNDEAERLLQYLTVNKPLRYHIRKLSKYYDIKAYYWKKGNVTPRMRWLNKHIRINSRV